ncbi:serine/threonine protein kinase [Saprolegnia parasitica CBS 223.65]|uniref:Serine/threonine protein kinase n=1 Tax=Saprolegnia parasitica (strain CBS 223.65) TaxID=695850 RepID=A0A067CH98_SAPPC|nr:serine/threonine protein kinase [Saprolegnia parasitica CBS 223.65]KDO29878.1 serine/threonine protein kinase [Saprolegnia parasitica CBS 223.65]|eukprot:XP_012199473.1 serine/threonine protein kinase [Saprolegnia parasitica CBS 223.65]
MTDDRQRWSASMLTFRGYTRLNDILTDEEHKHLDKKNLEHLQYVRVRHSGLNCANPTEIAMPAICLPLDRLGGAIALRDYNDVQAIIGRCRCGYVCQAYYFTRDKFGNSWKAIALKVMDKNLIAIERDDIGNEVRIMAQLQPHGMSTPLRSKHVLRWATTACARNEYIATDYVASGSLSSFLRRAYESMLKKHAQSALLPLDLRHRVAREFLETVALPLYGSILQGLVYIHTQGVCHLDIDPYNIAVGREHGPEPGSPYHYFATYIDFGSSQLLDGRLLVGAGRENPAIKAKITYRSPELKTNAQERTRYINYVKHHRGAMSLQEERREMPKGFDGRASDLYSVGVVGIELLLYGFQLPGFLGSAFVSTSSNPKWRDFFVEHFDKSGVCPTPCLFCDHKITLPESAVQILLRLVGLDVKARGSADQAALEWMAAHGDKTDMTAAQYDGVVMDDVDMASHSASSA